VTWWRNQATLTVKRILSLANGRCTLPKNMAVAFFLYGAYGPENNYPRGASSALVIAMIACLCVCACVCVCMRACVCMCVTRRYYIKTAKRKITQTTPRDSPWTLVFWRQNSSAEDPGFPLKVALKVTQPLQTAQFRPIFAHSASTVRASEKVQLVLIGSRPRPYLPKIWAKSNPPPSENADFDRFRSIVPQPWELARKIQLSLIGSRQRAFHRAIDEPWVLPLSPRKGGSKREFLHLALPFISSLQVVVDISNLICGLNIARPSIRMTKCPWNGRCHVT